jgi:hypothetical protein
MNLACLRQEPAQIVQWKDVDDTIAFWQYLSTVKMCLELLVAEQTRTQGLRVEAVAAVGGRIASMSDQEPSAFFCRSQRCLEREIRCIRCNKRKQRR